MSNTPHSPPQILTPVPLIEVDHIKSLTDCLRCRANWSRRNPLRPFVQPTVIRVLHIPAPEIVPPPDMPLANVSHPDGWGGGRRMLLVDDKHHYRRVISEYFARNRGWHIEAVATAAEAAALVAQRPRDYYAGFVSDISMELELSGLYLCYVLRRLGFRGLTILASTGFDVWFGMFFTQLLAIRSGLQWMIPKQGFNTGRVRMLRCHSLV